MRQKVYIGLLGDIVNTILIGLVRNDSMKQPYMHTTCKNEL